MTTPSASPNDLRSQTLDNAEFISNKNDYVSIILAKDPAGSFKAYVLRSTDKAREPILASDPCETASKAHESLYNKSCEAVHQFTSTNGFSYPPDLTNSGLLDDKDDDDRSETSSTGTKPSSPPTEYEGSENGDGSVTLRSVASPLASVYREVVTNPLCEATGSCKAQDCLRPRDHQSEDEFYQIRSNSPPRAYSVNGTSRMPGPPPPGWPHPPAQPLFNQRAGPISAPGTNTQRPVSFAMNQNQILRGPPPMLAPPMGPYHTAAPRAPATIWPTPPPPSLPAGPPNGRSGLHDVRLSINWLYHSEVHVLESSRPSVRAIQEAALGYVRGHLASFDNVSPLDRSPGKIWSLRAVVKRGHFGRLPGASSDSEPYDMTCYRADDLTRLLSGMAVNSVPLFEIEVDYAQPQPRPAGPPNRGMA